MSNSALPDPYRTQPGLSVLVDGKLYECYRATVYKGETNSYVETAGWHEIPQRQQLTIEERN